MTEDKCLSLEIFMFLVTGLANYIFSMTFLLHSGRHNMYQRLSQIYIDVVMLAYAPFLIAQVALHWFLLWHMCNFLLQIISLNVVRILMQLVLEGWLHCILLHVVVRTACWILLVWLDGCDSCKVHYGLCNWFDGVFVIVCRVQEAYAVIDFQRF